MCYKFPLFRIQIFLINEFVPQEIMESMKEIIHNKKWGKFNCFGIYAWLILGITSCYHKVQEEKNSVNKEIVQQQEKIRSFFPFPEIPFHPELLLKDLVKVFHPDILKDYTPRYFTNLAE